MKPEKKLFWTQVADNADGTIASICALLQEGEITDCKLLPRGSNDVFLLSLRADGQDIRAIYKPRRGEAPLWDFPDGTLYQRECAAYLVSQALRWFLVPPTVIREGPLGIGALQWFVDSKPADYSALLMERSQEFKRLAAFDCLVNNADRKSGHCLQGLDGRLWFIDHGLTFHVMPKLRTVIWNFSGQPVPEEIVADLEQFQHRLSGDHSLRTALHQLLSAAEVEALEARLRMILKQPVFPDSFGSYYRRPWPSF